MSAPNVSPNRIIVLDSQVWSTGIVDPNQGDVPEPKTKFVDVGPIAIHGTVEDVYSTAQATGAESALDNLVEILGFTNRRLRLLKRGQRTVIELTSVTPGVTSMPIYLAGDGFKRLIYIACVVASQLPGELVLIDEPEAFQHPRYMRELAKLIWGGIAQGVQIVLTTHSGVLINALLNTEGVDQSKLTILRTQLQDGVLSGSPSDGFRAGLSNPLPIVDEEIRQKAAKANAEAQWVTREGYTKLPANMVKDIGVGDGSLLWFLKLMSAKFSGYPRL